MKYFSFHTHSHFCDGKAPMKDVCKRAVAEGLSAIGFSSHAPVPFSSTWAMKFEDALEYRKAIDQFKYEYKNQLNIYAALEADYIPLGKSVAMMGGERC
nr:PHP domain-containing protein [uncultured Carboxylicivirga sp.]